MESTQQQPLTKNYPKEKDEADIYKQTSQRALTPKHTPASPNQYTAAAKCRSKMEVAEEMQQNGSGSKMPKQNATQTTSHNCTQASQSHSTRGRQNQQVTAKAIQNRNTPKGLISCETERFSGILQVGHDQAIASNLKSLKQIQLHIISYQTTKAFRNQQKQKRS